MAVNRLLKKVSGVTYIELMAGMGILLMGIVFITVMYRVSSQNRIFARETTAVSTVAQNMAEVYKATSGTQADAVNAALAESASEGFPAGRASVTVVSGTVEKVTITIMPRVDIPGMRSTEAYRYVFYTLSKSSLNQ